MKLGRPPGRFSRSGSVRNQSAYDATSSLPRSAMLTPSQTDSYRRTGHLVVRDFLTAEEVAEFTSLVDSISAGNTRDRFDAARVEMEPDQPPEGTRVRRIYEPCTYYPRFRAFSESEKVLECVSSLLGPDVTFHYSKINM